VGHPSTGSESVANATHDLLQAEIWPSDLITATLEPVAAVQVVEMEGGSEEPTERTLLCVREAPQDPTHQIGRMGGGRSYASSDLVSVARN
jgi:hypothetical protein